MYSNRAKFVTMVINGSLVVFKRKKQDLEAQMSTIFPRVDGAYDYLLNIKTVDYTEERVASLLEESKQAKMDLEIMKHTSPLVMWENDIKNI